MKPIGVFGGTFDPVHLGHLRVAFELYQALGLAEVRMIPARQPPHRALPQTSAEDRSALLEAALRGQTALRLDRRELERDGPSYTVDTLASLREELGEVPICLILGGDAFAGLETWHRWEDIIDQCHVIVAHRPGWSAAAQTGLAQRLLQERGIRDPAALARQRAGMVLPWGVTQLDISASRIRGDIAAGREPRYLLPEAVWAMIQARGLYQTTQE